MKARATQQQIVEQFRLWREKPQVMVRELWPGFVPDAWQDDVFEAFPSSPRLAMRACKGPGKTCVLAMLAWNFLLTRHHPRVGAISITGDNLRANLWTELASWREKSPLLKEMFEQTKTEIFLRAHPKTWKLEARQWAQDATSEQIGTALAGLHAPYVMWLVDESGGMPDAILPVLEGIFLGEPIEAHIVQAGNALKLSGPLYRACKISRHLWKVIEITGDPDDPKRSPRISIEEALSAIHQYGRNNSFVKVNIFGEFPESSIDTLLGMEEVETAQRRSWKEHEISHAARIMGVDVARFGLDASVLFKRQGLVAFPPLVWRILDGIQGAGQVAKVWQEWDATACFVDNTGGFGAAWLDCLRLLGRSAIGVAFSGSPIDGMRYYNKRAEMYLLLREWVREGGQLPPDLELAQTLTQIQYTFVKDKFLIEEKDQLKKRLEAGAGLDKADALALTFAQPVAPPHMRRGRRGSFRSEYDPYAITDAEIRGEVRW